MSERIILGTRGSKLALAQAEKVASYLREAGKEIRIQIIKTPGDVMKNKPLYELKRTGSFVRRIDEALSKGEIDIAVHSMKDIPTKMVENVVIAAVLERESPFDAFISASGKRIEDLDSGSVIGTSSLRRIAQIRRFRKDLKIRDIRGDLETRLRKLSSGEFDGIIVSEAGLMRLGIDKEVDYQRLSAELFVPSANQGIIAITTRKGEEDLVSFMTHRKTMLEALVEREILKELGIGCTIPAGIFAELKNEYIRIICEILNVDGAEILTLKRRVKKDSAFQDAKEIAKEIKETIGKSFK